MALLQEVIAALGFVRMRHRAISISTLIVDNTIISSRSVLNADLTLIWFVLATEPAYSNVCITKNTQSVGFESNVGASGELVISSLAGYVAGIAVTVTDYLVFIPIFEQCWYAGRCKKRLLR